MKAVIMAGGEGSRLRPMTCSCPKPMVPVLDKPVMAYSLELLSRHGVKEAAVTVMYMPNCIIDYFGDGEDYGVKLKYYTETTPLGTAGSVGMAQDFLDETFVVLSADGLTDCDITKAVEFHRARNAEATMVLKKVPSPLDYGVVLTDSDGRVRRFVEKPGWGEACSDAVNTGIYILEPQILQKIPRNRPYDFGREMFPKLVEEGRAVYGFLMDGYWCDIGDVGAYLKANFDMLDGKIAAEGLRAGCVNRMPGSSIDRSAILEAPCFIAPGARIEAGARIGAYSVIGSTSVIGQDSSLKRSVIWRGARIGERNSLRGCVTLGGVVTMSDVSAFEESVIGEGAIVGQGATLMSSIRVWPRKLIEDGERVDRNVVWGQGVQRSITDGVFSPDSPSRAIEDIQAFVSALGLKRVIVARDSSLVASGYLRAVISGLMAQGVQTIDMQKATLPVMRFCQRWAMADGAAYVSRDGIIPLDEIGAGLSRAQCRRVASVLTRGEYPSPFSSVTKDPIALNGFEMCYVSGILGLIAGSDMSKIRAAVYCQNEAVLTLAERAMRQAGISVRAEWEEEMMELGQTEIGIWLDETGQRADFADDKGIITNAERALILSWTALESGESELILPNGETRVAAELAEKYSAKLRWTSSVSSIYERALLESGGIQYDLQFDGIKSAIIVLARLADANTTMRDVLKALSPRYRKSRATPVELRDKGRLIRQLSEIVPQGDVTDGITVETDEGWAYINPCGDRRECTVTAEALTQEYAKELCDFCVSRIENILNEK